MAKREMGACILSDPVNIRYATGARNMQIFTARNSPSRYLLLTDQESILYEFPGCFHLAAGLPTLTEIRPAIAASFVAAGERITIQEQRWAREIASTLRELVGQHAQIGMERMNAGATLALSAQGFKLVDAQAAVEMARSVKSPEEITCIRAALRATETAVSHMRNTLRPGMTENELWSVLHQSVIADDGEYCETRLLSSGVRTNPWFQETGSKVIGANELVAFDTDVVGCYGYYCDFSRTFHSGPDQPTRAQRSLYSAAYEQVQHNLDILKPGLSFREYSELAWEIPEKYLTNRYYVSSHGCGMTGEYPYLFHRADFSSSGYDGVIEPGMTLCVESYIGEPFGVEGVKLEEQCLITQNGVEILSSFPFESILLSGGA